MINGHSETQKSEKWGNCCTPKNYIFTCLLNIVSDYNSSMLWSQLLALFAIAQLSLASPRPLAERYTTLRKRHSWDAPPRGWEFHSAPDAGEVIELRIGLRQGRVDELILSLYEVSEPGHQRCVPVCMKRVGIDHL